MSRYDQIITFVRELYRQPVGIIPLHAPVFCGREKEYLADCIDSTYVSSIGGYVTRFEKMMCDITGARHAVAVVNGTSALHLALRTAGVRAGDEVITQPLSFVATANGIAYCGARPLFLDIDRETLGLSPDAVASFLDANTEMRQGRCYNTITGNKISACVPMHTFGHPCRVDRIVETCRQYGITVIEDAAESLGSLYRGRHTGTFGRAGIFSLNGNKIVTSGGGGVIITDDENFAQTARFLSTTAKTDTVYFEHSEIGYNYRLPNVNAALGCAQLEQLDAFLQAKRGLAQEYESFFKSMEIRFVAEPGKTRSNYWLNSIILPDRKQRDLFLEEATRRKIQARPAWKLLNTLPMYRDCTTDHLATAGRLAPRIVNLPSSVRP